MVVTRMVPLGVAIAAGLFALIKPFDSDLWLHLATGRLFWESGLPRTNTFSYTHPEYPWEVPHWGFSALLYGIERVGGSAGIELLQIIAAGLAFALVAGTASRTAKRPNWILFLLLFVVALSACRFRFVPRPHLASFVGVAGILYLWARGARRLPLALAAIAAVWANLHPGVIYGTATIGLLSLGRLAARDRPGAMLGMRCFVAFLLGSLINPYHWKPYLYALSHLAIASRHTLPIIDFQPAGPAEFKSLYALGLLGGLAVIPRARRRDYFHVLAWAVWLVLAIKSRRMIPTFVISILPGTYAGLAAWIEGCRSTPSRRNVTRILIPVGAAGALFLLVEDARTHPEFEFGWGLNWKHVPEGASRFVEEQGLDGNMYNDYGEGGYFMWRLFPERRVFMDGRALAYPPEFFREILSRSRPGAWSEIVEKYRIDYAIVHRDPRVGTGDWGSLFDGLGWPLVYLDGTSGVFARPGLLDGRSLDEVVYQIVGYDDDAPTLIEKARSSPLRTRRELERIDPEGLVALYDFYRFGLASLQAGDRAGAAAFFRKGIERYPRHAKIREEYERLFPDVTESGR
jgi:uncharacterized membrane protein YtjA (UPF0391 family)